MPALPARTTMSNPYPAPTDAAGRAWFLGLWDSFAGLLGSAATPASARDGLLLPKRAAKNLLVNPNFSINQRGAGSGYFSGSGDYVRDRWINGGSATVTATGGTGRLTSIDGAGYLYQNILLESGKSYTLSNTGTAKFRVRRFDDVSYIPFSSGPISITATSSTIGYEISVSDGTLGTVLLEEGAFATEAEKRSDLEELRICQQYCFVFNDGFGIAITTANVGAPVIRVPVPMQGVMSIEGTATFTASNGSNGTVGVSASPPVAASKNSIYIFNSANNWTVGALIRLNAVFVPS